MWGLPFESLILAGNAFVAEIPDPLRVARGFHRDAREGLRVIRLPSALYSRPGSNARDEPFVDCFMIGMSGVPISHTSVYIRLSPLLRAHCAESLEIACDRTSGAVLP